MKTIKHYFLTVLLMGLSSAQAFAYDAEVNGIYYNLKGDEAEVTDGEKEYSGNIVIPATIVYGGKRYNVTSIEKISGDDVRSIIVGPNVRHLKYTNSLSNGFYRKIIWLPNTAPVSVQDNYGVMNFVANEQYPEPKSGKFKFIFPLLSSMFEVDGIRYVPISIPDRTCEAIDCLYDESATLTKLGTNVTFQGITFSVNYVRPYTCFRNDFIKNLVLTDLPFIDDYVFYGCTNLESVKLPETVTWIGHGAFSKCSKIQEIVIPAATKKVSGAFYGCTSMKRFILNDSDEPLTWTAVWAERLNDNPLDSAYVGRYINYHIYSPFQKHPTLRAVCIADRVTTIPENEFQDCFSLKNVWIGDGVTDIKKWAFSGCTSLDYFEFGTSMKNISEESFSDCANIRNIISHAATPPTCGPQALDDINKWTCTLTVPDASRCL